VRRRIEARLQRARTSLEARRKPSAGLPPGTDLRSEPWPSAIAKSTKSEVHRCNICGWHGAEFASGFHSEGALCPSCGSIARDRFLYWSWTHRTPYEPDATVLETSPRLDDHYRQRMAQIVRYLSSDYDESAHKGAIKLDLQDAALADSSVDIILTPHVLEHVPDTSRALSEIFRILKPGGRMYLQIPMPQGVTAPPTEPEYHGDRTLVYWRFGWDLREQLEKAGFTVESLVTESLRDRVKSGQLDSSYGGPDCDEVDLLTHADADQLLPIASAAESHRFGFLPDFMFITWEAVKPA
jgi:SAM-dependent methyltransferase